MINGVCTAWFLKCPPMDGHSHFENLQSTNWNSLRFKPPPSEDSDIGWRVEFRPMDIQLTDFENTALTVAVGMIANLAGTYDLDFILPISKVDENMERAHDRDALLSTKFWWKIPAEGQEPETTPVANLLENQFERSNSTEPEADVTEEQRKVKDEARYKELYIWQILNGDESIGFKKGLIPLCKEYMALKNWEEGKVASIMVYLNFLSDRAKGIVPTGATFLRQFVN